ncbi:MAG: L-fucose isomerase [Acutalibacteraceae bacterium]|nr:L-fucose isomerase [Clostridiales bacterium]
MKAEHVRIGIRPVIDGRWGGIREGLEEQTMGMAVAAKELIESHLRYPDGAPVECVIADGTIGGGEEAARCAQKFSHNNVCATLSVTPCWCYGSETMDLDPLTIKAVWGFNGTERPGAVYLAAAMAAHAQRGLPAFSIYGHDVQDKDDKSIPADVQEKILRFAKAAVATGAMRNKAYVGVGSVAMGIAGSFLNPDLMQKYFGIRAEWVDMSEITRRMDRGIYDPVEAEKALKWAKEHCPEGDDNNEHPHSREEKDAEWEYVTKMTIIVRDILFGNPRLDELGFHEEALGRNAIVGGFQGQRMWTDHKPNGDFMESMLNSSFDWNGIREAITFATENDTLNGMAMLFLHLLTNQATVFSDVRTYWSPDAVKRVTGWTAQGKAENGFMHLINSGASALDGTGREKDGAGNAAMKPWWDITEKDADECLKATRWAPANLGYFRGGGFSSQFSTTGEMPVTMVRLNMVEGIGPVLQVAEGYTVDLPADVDKTLLDRTDPTWPSTWFAPRLTGKGAFKDVYSVMANWGANHGAWTYGHVGADVLTMASMMRIPVSMHNVPEEKIYRPHAWSAFGTCDPEGADYRACAAYGPLYR